MTLSAKGKKAQAEATADVDRVLAQVCERNPVAMSCVVVCRNHCALGDTVRVATYGAAAAIAAHIVVCDASATVLVGTPSTSASMQSPCEHACIAVPARHGQGLERYFVAVSHVFVQCTRCADGPPCFLVGTHNGVWLDVSFIS